MSNKTATAVEAAVQETIEKSLQDQAKSYLLRAAQKKSELRAQIEGLEKNIETVEAYEDALLAGLKDDSLLTASNVLAFHNATEQNAARNLIGY